MSFGFVLNNLVYCSSKDSSSIIEGYHSLDREALGVGSDKGLKGGVEGIRSGGSSKGPRKGNV